jgi:hypothetical protein
VAVTGRSTSGTAGDVDLPDAAVEGEVLAVAWEDIGLPSPLREAAGGSRGTDQGRSRAQRLADVAEAVCRCSKGGDPAHACCGGVCAMAARETAREARRGPPALAEVDLRGRSWDDLTAVERLATGLALPEEEDALREEAADAREWFETYGAEWADGGTLVRERDLAPFWAEVLDENDERSRT